jgi:N-acetylglucosaminyl-diphospho-decaprenol L-rhamnosyltransferase
MPEPRTTVSVVVVNWNAGPALDACLASVAGQGAREIVVVDNGSTDGSADGLTRRAGVRVVAAGRNLGFAAGANLGAAEAVGEVLVFLNPDAVLLPGALGTLVDALLRVPGAGIAGGGLTDDRGRWQPGAARFAPVAHLVLDTTVGRLPDRWRRAPRRVDWVYGTFMAVRRDLFRQLGGFDPRYFLYGEDLDLCWRASRFGARTLHVPAARALHGPNVSARQRFGGARDAEVVRGEMRFYARRGAGALGTFRTLAACKFGLKACVAALAGRPGAAAAYAGIVRACVGFRPEGTADAVR